MAPPLSHPQVPLAMDPDLNAPHSMGTTITGVTYDGGVVLGADSRTTTGIYAANLDVSFSLILHIRVGVYVANRASDKITPLTDNILFVRTLLETGGLIVGGWDKYEGGQIYSVPLGGTILRQPFAIGGSGSTYLYAFFDQAWKEGMSKDEAEKFMVKAVSLAMARDGASGGVVRTVIINAELLLGRFSSTVARRARASQLIA
ncbi:proteasome subunit beta type-6 [Phoenix dactylifera]|uniref:Proteasome subunit beta type-6 n=1 Tax=Phoenix dactylifera TaxID=42345 RepID=A0A8B9ABM8_PHODC|nr:proteasome subunit beta type-6 [Phoenix dactylifera]